MVGRYTPENATWAVGSGRPFAAGSTFTSWNLTTPVLVSAGSSGRNGASAVWLTPYRSV